MALILVTGEILLAFLCLGVHKMSLCVLESLAPLGTPGQRFFASACPTDELEVVVATGDSNAGKRIADHVPALAAAYPSMVFEETNQVLTSDVDVVFLALPHGHSQTLVPQARRTPRECPGPRC
jgi:hypothetical protein